MENKYSLTSKMDESSASVNWFRPQVPPEKIRALMEKSDIRPMLDTMVWIGLMVTFGSAAIILWPTWWSVPFFLAYGVLYGSASDSRWHECGHKTAFKTVWMNNVVYHIASFMLIRSPVVWRSSHVRHHTSTIIVGHDPEIIAMRPPDLVRLSLNLFGLVDTYHLIMRMFLHASGRLHPEETTYTRKKDYKSVFLTARIWILIYALTISCAFWIGSILPILLIGLPRLYGAWHHVITGVLQHLGLAENVSDHRLNTRTVLMNPISRFIYLNMNYHVEHHMFTMIPYYHLPKLHELIKYDLPTPEPSIFSAFYKLIPVLLRQLRYQDAVIIPNLPKGATPYRKEVERLKPFAI